MNPPTGTHFALPHDTPGPVTTLLSVLHGAHSVGEGVFGFLSTREARALRLVSRECLDAVKAARWRDESTPITGPLASWRACFPGAIAAHVRRVDYGKMLDVGGEFYRIITEAALAHLAGIRTVVMRGCRISDAGLARLKGIHTLDMSHCDGFTDAGLAHLTGIHTLDMRFCTLITDAGLAHLTGIHTLSMTSGWITDAGLAHLTGIHTLVLHSLDNLLYGISDAGLAHLTGIHTLAMHECYGITDAGLAHLTGIHTLDMGRCTGITDAGLAHLTGINTLSMSGCDEITTAGLAHLIGIKRLHIRYCKGFFSLVDAARAMGLSVNPIRW
jgi:hypothetical protein